MTVLLRFRGEAKRQEKCIMEGLSTDKQKCKHKHTQTQTHSKIHHELKYLQQHTQSATKTVRQLIGRSPRMQVRTQAKRHEKVSVRRPEFFDLGIFYLGLSTVFSNLIK